MDACRSEAGPNRDRFWGSHTAFHAFPDCIPAHEHRYLRKKKAFCSAPSSQKGRSSSSRLRPDEVPVALVGRSREARPSISLPKARQALFKLEGRCERRNFDPGRLRKLILREAGHPNRVQISVGRAGEFCRLTFKSGLAATRVGVATNSARPAGTVTREPSNRRHAPQKSGTRPRRHRTIIQCSVTGQARRESVTRILSIGSLVATSPRYRCCLNQMLEIVQQQQPASVRAMNPSKFFLSIFRRRLTTY